MTSRLVGFLAIYVVIADLFVSRSAFTQIVTTSDSSQLKDECADEAERVAPSNENEALPNYFADASMKPCEKLNPEEIVLKRRKRHGVVLVVTGVLVGIPARMLFDLGILGIALDTWQALFCLIPAVPGLAFGIIGPILGGYLIGNANAGFRRLGVNNCKSRMCLRQVSLFMSDRTFPSASNEKFMKTRLAELPGLKMDFSF